MSFDDDDRKRADAIEKTFKLSNGLYLVGSLETGVTIYRQQVRAHNLVWALWEIAQASHAEPSSIAIVGGGITGLTVAACVLSRFKKSQVTVFEKHWDFCPLAVPFSGPQGEIVLVLYAECAEFNFFSNNATVESVNSMCRGFCRLIDWEQEATPLPTIRNFPLQKGAPIKHEPTVYSHLQEALDLAIPSFQTLASFNYETSVS